ncbi:MAG: tyrosine-type recombinase/integrase [Myxococcota bacterium]
MVVSLASRRLRELDSTVTTFLLRVIVSGDHCALFDGAHALPQANAFLDAVRVRGLSPRTVRAYAFDLLCFYRWLNQSGRALPDLHSADLVDFIAEQQRAGAAPRSINRRLTTVRQLFLFFTGRALDQGPGILRPALHYKGPGRERELGLHRLHRRTCKVRVKEPRFLVEPLGPDQVRSFLRSLTRYRDLVIVHLMLLTGLRSRELLQLHLDDVVWAEKRLHVRGKGQRDRVLPLPDIVLRILHDYVRLERPTRSTERHLFLVLQGARRGRPMTPAGLRSLFRQRRRQPTLALANPHRFRHTFGTDMARAGVGLPTLQRMMGHADMKTTLQYIELSMVDVADEYRRSLAIIERRYTEASRRSYESSRS